MKNKRMIALIMIILILLLVFIIFICNKKSKGVYISQDGVLLTISDGNGGTLSSVPELGRYDVVVNCTNADGSWDYYNWRLNVKNITGNVSCELSFNAINSFQTFAQYIISLSGTNQGTGKVVNENGYRYEGKNPNNFIWFNNELWRIIGVFGSESHGVSNTNLVKIIRNESIGGYSWNGTNDQPNDWPNSTLYRMLNGCYYNALTGSDTTNISGSSVACSNYCVGSYFGNMISVNCDFSTKGLQVHSLFPGYGYRDMVQTVTWYLGGPRMMGSDTLYPANVYSLERDSSAISSGNSASVTANVGLMYLSDYGYSALNNSCTRGTYDMEAYQSGGYSDNNCVGNNWMYSQGDEWAITPVSDISTESWNVSYRANLGGYYCYNGLSVRPVVYLKNSVYKISGDGTIDNPYIVTKDYENTFNYSSNVQTLQIVKSGYYKLETWGAKGGNGNNNTSYAGGNGGYAKGVIHLNKNDTLFIHTGGSGKGVASNGIQAGGTNGGGASGNYRGASGGGGTDIRINTDSLYARVIVAGGGGGGAYRSNYTGGAGGGTTGGDGVGYNTTYNAKGGTATAGGAAGGYASGTMGTAGSFGQGGAATTITGTNNYGRSGGGGGGWYGGGGGGYRSSSTYYYYGQSGGGGGSSYTYTSSTASQYPSGCLLNSSYYMTSTSTTAGTNNGDGYAKVTYCGQSASDCS